MPNTGRNYRHPPAIHHIGQRDENHTQTVQQAAKVVRLPDRATKLLTYYAGCSDGFRPALNTIRENTGIAKNAVSTIRKCLVTAGFILYGGGNICLLWDRIEEVARIEKLLNASNEK